MKKLATFLSFAGFVLLGLAASALAQSTSQPLQFSLVGVTKNQTLRLSAIGGDGGCLATLSFMDSTGTAVGRSAQLNLQPGQATWLDLPGSLVATRLGQRAEIQPLVTPIPGTVADCIAGAEVFDNLTTWDRVYRPPNPNFRPPNPNRLPAVGVGPVQTLRLKALAAGDVCVATLSFTDSSGNAIGSPMDISLSPGQGTWLDLNGGTFAGRTEVAPVTNPISGTCVFSADLFEQVTGSTLVTVEKGPGPVGF
ncbi:MAG TPA: hypothetical protein VKQ11_17645 [Candidatus Sulfotelmatobacter sp.]|nr:hypothetical protein [Candidatus Sulfotelmatobacter sp.]